MPQANMAKPLRPLAMVMVMAMLSMAACAIPAGAATALKSAASCQASQASGTDADPAPLLYAARPEALQWADDLAARRDLERQWLRQIIGQARFLPSVQRLMQPPPAADRASKNWHLYRSRFITPARIRAGLRFWQAQRSALARAEREYGVPAEIIVGIIGVETLYGQQQGRWRVLDALATLAFDFPAAHPRAQERTEFFRRELEQFLSLAQRSGMAPTEPCGSYAGAMGLGQFMPSSWVRYAVDFDGNGRIDLFNDPADAIGSVAHYLRGHGWTPGMATHFGVHFDTARLQLAPLLAPDILPAFSAAEMQAQGAMPDAAGAQHAGPLALVELHNGGAAPSYIAGTENFYAITRYNRSSYYALAVIELGRAVAMARAAQATR